MSICSSFVLLFAGILQPRSRILQSGYAGSGKGRVMCAISPIYVYIFIYTILQVVNAVVNVPDSVMCADEHFDNMEKM